MGGSKPGLILGCVVTMLCYRSIVYAILMVKVKRLNSGDTRDWFRRRRGRETTREEEQGLVLSNLTA
jgi:uncharacterized protein HemY